jgi:lysophospholipase L1-like esterase
MTPTLISRALPQVLSHAFTAALFVVASLATSGVAAKDFASTRPTARVEYWQQRQAAIAAQLADPASLRAVKLVFVGDSITDFWLLGDDPWIPGRMHGRSVWDESFGGAVPHNRALNIGISGDRTEHLLHRILPKAQGGLGQLDAEALVPEFFVLMVGINNSYAARSRRWLTACTKGVLAVMRALHARKPGTRLLLQSILPTSEPSQRDEAVVKPVNERLAAQHVGQVHAVAHAQQQAQFGRFGGVPGPCPGGDVGFGRLMAEATCASTPLPLPTSATTLVSKVRVSSSAHSTCIQRSLSRSNRRLPVWHSAVCTTRPSPRPR